MDGLVSRASMIRLSLHPLPASETSAFNKIRAFSTRRAGLFPFRSNVSSRSRSSPLSLTTYFFTEISFAAMIASLASRWRRKRIIGLEDLSRPADARQQPSHDSVVRLAATALKLVLLDSPFGEGRGLICRLSLVLRKRHPLANDFPTRLVVFHVCSSLGCNFSTRLEATASFTASRNSSGLAHAIRTASMWRAGTRFVRTCGFTQRRRV